MKTSIGLKTRKNIEKTMRKNLIKRLRRKSNWRILQVKVAWGMGGFTDSREMSRMNHLIEEIGRWQERERKSTWALSLRESAQTQIKALK